MQSKREILQKALENINHPLSEITRRTTYRGHSPGVKPTTGIKLNLPKTSTMAAKMERVLADKSPEGRKRMKQMNNLVIGREEDGDKITLEFKTTASRERFRKMMNELSENVQLDEGSEITFSFDNPMKAGAFASRIMRDKLASEVDRYVSGRKEMVQIIMHPNDYERNDIERLAKQYKGQLREDLQLDETNFRFPQAGEDYGDLTKSISDDPYYTMSSAELKKRSRDIERKFAVMMRKHKGTKVGEVLDLLDKDGNTKVHQDNDIKLIKRYLTKFKDNVRKVAHQMMIDFMEGDDYLAKKRIPIREETEIVNFNFKNRSDAIAFNYQAKKQGLALRAKEFESQGNQTSHLAVDTSKLKTIGPKLKKLAKKYMGKYSTTGGGEEIDKMMREDVQLDETMTARDLESMIKGLKKGAKQEIADVLNDMDLSGYGDYEARVDNVHKFKTKDLFNAMKKVMKLESLKMSLDEKQKMTYVIDRSTKKVVHGPTDVADAKNYMRKQIQPRKFMIRDIRGAAKKVGDTV